MIPRIIGVDTEFEQGKVFLASSCDEHDVAKLYRAEDANDVRELRRLCEDKTITKVCHPQTVEQFSLPSLGIDLKGPVECTFIAASLVEGSMERVGLKPLAKKHIGSIEAAKSLKQAVSKYKRIAKKENRRFSWLEIDKEIIEPYALDDAVFTVGLWQKRYKNEIGPFRELYEFERDEVLPILARSQNYGMRIDREFVKGMMEEYEDEIEIRERRLNKILKTSDIESTIEEINFGSPKQVRRLFAQLGIESPKFTRGGLASYDKEVLSNLADDGVEFAQVLNELRFFAKQYGSYYWNLYHWYTNEVSEIARFIIFQVGARTGRMSAELIQTIPKPEESPIAHVEKLARRSFIPREGYTLVSADYKQIEMRMFFHLAKVWTLIEKVKQGWDCYEAVAEMIFGEGQGKAMRKPSKPISLGKIYGMGERKLIRQTKLPYIQAYRANKKYERMVPVRQYMQKKIREHKDKGYIEVDVHSELMDVYRRYQVPRGLEYKIVNYEDQGLSAYVLKHGMVRMDHMIRRSGYDANLLVPVHDELLFEVVNKEVKYFCKDVKKTMEDHKTFLCPMEVDIKTSTESWGQVEKWEDAA